MALSAEKLSHSESLLNKIATELILANPGQDDGMVPIYALVTELKENAGEEATTLGEACDNLVQALGELMDNGLPFDSRCLDYVAQFVAWAQEALPRLEQEQPVETFSPAPWISGEEEMEAADGFPLVECEERANRLATELVLAAAGTDDSLVPTYSLISDLADLCGSNDRLAKACEHVKGSLDALLDAALPWDQTTLAYVRDFSNWLQTSLGQMRNGADGPSVEFEPLQREAEPSGENVGGATVASSDIDEDDNLRAQLEEETDVLLVLPEDEDREILSEFQTEALEHLEQIEGALLVLENDPTDADSLAAIFRSFHTIKGVSGFLRLVPIQALAHEIEFLLDKARNGKLVLNSAMITLILKSQDTIRALVDQITKALDDNETPSEVIPVSSLIISARKAREEGLSTDDLPGSTQPSKAETSPPAPAENKATAEEKPEKAATSEEKPAASQTAAKVKSPAAQSAQAADRATIRVSTSKLDNLMDMVGELVIVQSQLNESGRSSDASDNSPLQRNLANLQRITRELQHTSMALRLVPIKPTFQKVGRLVRDLARQFNKQVTFAVEGEETELDRNVVEQISDPLVHMVRNSIDHGLEPNAEERKAAGKSEAGRIELKAYHLGSNIVIELSDDGRGLNPEKILKKARDRGIVGNNQELSDAEIVNLIFEPGFSTAEKVTDVSGRGVGMDVVRRNIENLRGKVDVESKVGKGTTFTIKLPLTTAIIDGLVVRVGDDKFILPTTSVQVALRPTKKQISRIKGRVEVLDLRGRTIPIMRLHDLFNIDTSVQDLTDGIIVIIETFGKPYGLLVDEMLSKQEVVIKSLGGLLQTLNGVAGGAILGDGTIALILDPVSLVKKH